MMREVQSALDKAVKGRTLKKNTAARKKSRFSKLIKNPCLFSGIFRNKIVNSIFF